MIWINFSKILLSATMCKRPDIIPIPKYDLQTKKIEQIPIVINVNVKKLFNLNEVEYVFASKSTTAKRAIWIKM